MLTALFNFVRNTQKSTWTVLFECQGKMFFHIENVLERISEDQQIHCFIVFLHIFEIKVSFLLSYNLRNIIKQNWH